MQSDALEAIRSGVKGVHVKDRHGHPFEVVGWADPPSPISAETKLHLRHMSGEDAGWLDARYAVALERSYED